AQAASRVAAACSSLIAEYRLLTPAAPNPTSVTCRRSVRARSRTGSPARCPQAVGAPGGSGVDRGTFSSAEPRGELGGGFQPSPGAAGHAYHRPVAAPQQPVRAEGRQRGLQRRLQVRGLPALVVG